MVLETQEVMEISRLEKEILQCHECEGYGHIIFECQLTKHKELKCGECKGFGPFKADCPNLIKKGERSLLIFRDIESEDEEDDEKMMNLVALSSEQEEDKIAEDSNNLSNSIIS